MPTKMSRAIKKLHTDKTSKDYAKYRTPEARERAANTQKEKRRNLHHDNITPLPHMLQFFRWRTEIGYRVNDLDGMIPAKKFCKITDTALSNITLQILDELYWEAIDYIRKKPSLLSEIDGIEDIQTSKLCEFDTLRRKWPMPKSMDDQDNKPKRMAIDPCYEKDRKTALRLKTKRYEDHNGYVLPLGIRPTKKLGAGYVVTQHPLLEDAEFKEQDINKALDKAIKYVKDNDTTRFRSEPLLRYIELYNGLPISSELLHFYSITTQYKFNTRK